MSICGDSCPNFCLSKFQNDKQAFYIFVKGLCSSIFDQSTTRIDLENAFGIQALSFVSVHSLGTSVGERYRFVL